MPNNTNCGGSSGEQLLGLVEDRGEPLVIMLSPNGRPSSRPRKTDGMASRISGIVMILGDSWILSHSSLGPRKSPQKVRPMSRNM